MSLRGTTIAAVILVAIAFAWLVPLHRLADGFSALVTALSILIAAVLVRLNRGMPTLDWKGLEPDERQRLTGSVLTISREYLIILAIFAAAAALVLGMLITGKDVIVCWPLIAQQIASGLIGGLLALCVCRMAYVVWRDYDIVRLQKTLIDAVGEREHLTAQSEVADLKIATSRAANLRRVPPPEVAGWPH